MDDEPRSAAEVVQRVERGWAALQALIADLDTHQLTAPGPEGWSVKDHLIHIGAWENALLTILGGRPQRDAFGLDADAYDRIDSVDQLNAIVYERNKDLPLDEVSWRVADIHQRLVAALRALTDPDLERTVADLGSDAGDDRPIRDKIEGDTYGHYAEHVGWIQEVRRFVLEQRV
ncbi:MAG TPA: DinB family protein [Chloroflexota bacterium]